MIIGSTIQNTSDYCPRCHGVIHRVDPNLVCLMCGWVKGQDGPSAREQVEAQIAEEQRGTRDSTKVSPPRPGDKPRTRV